MTYGLQIFGIERDLSEILQATRAIRNTYIPVNGLPPEILSGVLEYRTGERDLVAATHVCQYWRSTLTSSPPLWDCFRLQSYHDVDRTVTYLERSKSALIDVSMDMDSPENLKALQYFAPHIARTRSFIIGGLRADVLAASLLFCNPTPSLQHLEMSAYGGLVRLPDNFLGQQAPSLRSVSFSGIYPALEPIFPLPDLAEFSLYLQGDAGPFHMSALFRCFSCCPRLQKIYISASNVILQGGLDEVISLESLEELDYACDRAGQILPFLRLPRLKQLRVSPSSESGQLQKAVDLLPHGGCVLLVGTTNMLYYSDQLSLRVDLSGGGVNVSLSTLRTTADPLPVDWFSDETCTPFGQIEDLKVEGWSVTMDFPINVFAFENLGVLRVAPCDSQFTEEFLRLLHPDPGAGIPCQSLREIEYTTWGPSQEPLIRPLINLVRERKRAGHQLRLLRLSIAQGSHQDLVEELREHVGEVQVKVWGEGM